MSELTLIQNRNSLLDLILLTASSSNDVRLGMLQHLNEEILISIDHVSSEIEQSFISIILVIDTKLALGGIYNIFLRVELMEDME